MKVETFQAMGAVPVKDGIVFSMERKNNEEASLLLYKKGSKEVIQEIPFPATNTIGDIVCVKAEKIASARYEYNFCIDGKVTLDPYAKVLIGTGKFGEEHPEGHEVRCAMIAGNYDWEDDRKPQIAYEDAVMYSFHVRGFTKQRYSGVRHKGTFLGITEKAEYFKELGINQIKLMPAKFHAAYENLTAEKDRSPAKIGFIGSSRMMVTAILDCFTARTAIDQAVLIQMIALVAGYALVALFSLMGNLSYLSILHLILFQAVWAIIGTVVPNLKRY